MNLQMKNITKSFAAVKALTDAQLTVEQGSVHGLLGENGAGKTTLMNILAGILPPDSGDIIIDGEKIHKMTPHKSSELKIRFIHQELNLCNDLTVYQNMFLGNEIYTKIGTVDKKTEIERAQKVLDNMHSNIKATALVDDLETAQKQLVEIARALLFQSELIIMDEPTTALNNKEIEDLFTIMRTLKEQGVSFIYISHKMPEIFSICDRYTVLRDGTFIESGLIADINENKATELLIGRSFVSTNLKEGLPNYIKDEKYLSVENLSGADYHDVTFDVKKGEILVITGLQGSGSADLAMGLFSANPVKSGTIKTRHGLLKAKHLSDVMKSGIAMIPRNRKERGIISDLSIRSNHSMAYYTSKHKKLFVSQKEEAQRFEKNRQSMSIKAASDLNLITSLSGGNQQKVIVGKWLNIDADVYLMDNPTQGVDVGAKFEIYKLIHDLASKGKAIIVFSNEFPEIFQLADRTLVLYKGKVNGIINRDKLTEEYVMALSTGSKQEARI